VTSAAVATGLSYVGMTVSGGMNVPQLIRSTQGASVAGVSCTTYLLAAFSAALWCFYGVTAPLPAQIPGNLVALAAAALVVRALIRRGTPLLLPAIAVLTFVASSEIVYAIGGPLVVGWMAAAISTVRSAPQLWTSMRAPGIVGISPATWAMAAVASSTWLGFAVLAGDLPVLCSSGACLVVAIVILVAMAARRTSCREATSQAQRLEGAGGQ
jgi:uncharacterized protein with PQ loop repeat